MNDLEKLITDLSNYWDLSPEKVVDRLNHMNESEIKNVVNKMTTKFEKGGLLPKSKFEDGGIIKCLKGGKTYTECKKCGGKTLKAEGGEKVRRTDRPGNAGTHADGTDVLTQDAVGPQPLPGSYYSIEGSTPEWETGRTALTNKGGDILGYNYDVYLNDGDHIFSPVNKYTTKRMWNRPSTGLRRELTPKRAAEMKAAYDANKLAKGGSVEKAALGTEIGGKISKVARSTMFDDASAFMPEADRKFVRTAYRTAKNHGRDLGLRGWSLRNWSKNQVSDRFRDYADQPVITQMASKVVAPQLPILDDVVIEDEPITFNDPFKGLDFSEPVIKPMKALPKGTPTNASITKGSKSYTVQRGNTLGQIVSDYNKNNPGANLKGQDVAKWSGISDPSKMQIGHIIHFSDPNANPSSTISPETPVSGNSDGYTAFQKGQLLTEPVLYTPPTQFNENGIYQFGATHTQNLSKKLELLRTGLLQRA